MTLHRSSCVTTNISVKEQLTILFELNLDLTLSLQTCHNTSYLLQWCYGSKTYYLSFQLFFLYSPPLPHVQVSLYFHGHGAHEHVPQSYGKLKCQSSLQTPRKWTPFLNKYGTFRLSFSFLPFPATLRRGCVAMSLMGVSTSLVGVCHQSTNKISLLNITELHAATTQGRPKSYFHISLLIKQEFQLQVLFPPVGETECFMNVLSVA